MYLLHTNKYNIHYDCFLIYRLIGGSDYKLIYRHYATLYFVFCVDSSESELGILDLIQVRNSYSINMIALNVLKKRVQY